MEPMGIVHEAGSLRGMLDACISDIGLFQALVSNITVLTLRGAAIAVSCKEPHPAEELRATNLLGHNW